MSGADLPKRRIRILKVPPTHRLEGFDLRPFDFQAGRLCDVQERLAEVLLRWDYAESVSPLDQTDRQSKKPTKNR